MLKNVSFWDTLELIRDTNVIVLVVVVCSSTDVTFFEDQSYFSSQNVPQTHGNSNDCVLAMLPLASISPTTSRKFQFADRTYHRRSTIPTMIVQPSSAPDSFAPPSVVVTTSNPDLPITSRKGTRSCVGHPIDRYSPYYGLSNCVRTRHPISNFLSYDRLSPTFFAFVSSLSFIYVPSNVVEALAHSGWRRAMEDKMETLIQNKTWELTSLPIDKQPVSCRWVSPLKFTQMVLLID